jgi:pentatricopeptide repeat protein
MHRAGIELSPVTISCVLPACAILAALQQGKEIHNYAIKRELRSNVSVGSALVDMYGKCGDVEIARKVFDKMNKRDVILWTSLIAGYGMHGYGEDALALFHHMERTNLKPDHVTFVALLSACSHAGLINEGWQCFDRMKIEYRITPLVEHYACMVDLLGRSGHLDEAYEFIKKMPIEPSSGVWGALLGACRVHCNVHLAEIVAEHLFEMEPGNPGFYVLLSNIYAAVGRRDGVHEVRSMMKERGVKKMPGCSWIELNNKVHAFIAGDKSHPRLEEIHATLENLVQQLKEEGYSPDTRFVLDDVEEEEEKKRILSGHSEKLAIIFGLISTSPGTPIRITKNLRMCGDCHSASKYISKVVARRITVRDLNRFHHFEDGLCSCGDYW